jgi:putative salt-induced outer membrane protein YdiY
VTVLTALTSTLASADELHLKNGDRYTGSVVSLDRGSLKFDTGHGTLDVPWGDVMTMAVAQPVMVTLGGQRERGAVISVAADGGMTLRYVDGDVDTPRPIALSDIVGLRRPLKPFSLTGGANVGFLTTGGNTDVNSLHADAELVARARENRYTTSGAVNTASDNGRETARNATGLARYDRFLSRQLYLNGSGIFTHDRFRDLDLRTALAVGAGYQAVDNTRAKVGVEGGYGYVNERFATQPDISFHAARETVSVDVFVGGRRAVLFHRNDGFFGFTDRRLFVQTRNGVRLALVGGLVTTLQYDLDYDRTPAAGRKQTDHSVGLTFGYRF